MIWRDWMGTNSVTGKPRPGRVWVNVQWKGIPSCFDTYCECGVYAHLDDEYFGRWKCDGCGRSFQLAWTATAFSVPKETK